MASKKLRKTDRQITASPGDVNKSPCAFCQRNVDDELVFGKLYAIGDIQCHYFCVLLSCCIIQKGKDEVGLFGFLYSDILAEIERSKKHKCSYCNKVGATLGCSVSQCRKQFHLPCGRNRNAVSLFHGNYKSFCQQHAPKQKIPEHIMCQAKKRLKLSKTSQKLQEPRNFSDLKELTPVKKNGLDLEPSTEIESVCVICYETVDGFPSPHNFWPPCCARDAWFHRTCLQRMALTAGMHYLKCPLCNDKDNFYEAVLSQGFYVPDRDAAWELEQDAFADIYEREVSCDVDVCLCPLGRGHDSNEGPWNIVSCIVCGAASSHLRCGEAAGGPAAGRSGGPAAGGPAAGGPAAGGPAGWLVCAACAALVGDVRQLTADIHEVIKKEQAEKDANNIRKPVMPSRMSLRRTKQRPNVNTPSSSIQNTITSRLELNLKPPRKPTDTTPVRQPTVIPQPDMFSPTKVLKESLVRKGKIMGLTDNVDSKLIETVRERFKKPRPLSVKKKIVNEILDNYLIKFKTESPKRKKTPQASNSPKICFDINDGVQKKMSPIRIIFKTSKNTESNNHNDATENPSPRKLSTDNKTDEPVPELPNNEQTNEAYNDESSNSTFQLPSEFIAETLSDDSVPFLETPKLKTVDIEKNSSLEISKDDQTMNIDMFKLKSENNDSVTSENKLLLKFCNKSEVLDNNIDIDLDSFKSQYLTEVDRNLKCSFNHQHIEAESIPKSPVKLRTALDFALEAFEKENNQKNDVRTNKLKRKLAAVDPVPKKKKKKGKKAFKKQDSIQIVCSKKTDTNVIDLSLDSKIKKHTKKIKRKIKKNKNISVRNIQVKIKWKEEELNLQITKSNKKKNKFKHKKDSNASTPLNLKQYILKYSPEGSSSKDVISKPEGDLSPLKRKYVKQEKTPDSLKQTSIQNFFKKLT